MRARKSGLRREHEGVIVLKSVSDSTNRPQQESGCGTGTVAIGGSGTKGQGVKRNDGDAKDR